jgi:hypothetical protein
MMKPPRPPPRLSMPILRPKPAFVAKPLPAHIRKPCGLCNRVRGWIGLGPKR